MKLRIFSALTCLAAIFAALTSCGKGTSPVSSRTSSSAKIVAQMGDPEPNDTKETATPLVGDFSGVMLSTSTNDDDWFLISPESNALVFLSLSFNDELGDIAISVHKIKGVDENGVVSTSQVTAYDGVGALRQLLFVSDDSNSNYLVHIIANEVEGATSLIPYPTINYDFQVTCQPADLAGSPLLSPIGDRYRAPNVGLSLNLMGASTNPSASLTYSISGLPEGYTFNSSTGVLNWTPSEENIGSYEVLARVTDTNADLDDWEEFTITVTYEEDGALHRFFQSNHGMARDLDPLSYNSDEILADSSPLTSFAMADLDANGLRDVIWHNYTTSTIHWALNQGASFDRDAAHSISFGGVNGFQVIDFLTSVGDELVAYSSTTGLIRIYSMVGGVGPTHLAELQGAIGASESLVIDYDGDNDLDIVQIVPNTQSVVLLRASNNYAMESITLGSIPVALLEPRGMWTTGVLVFACDPNKLFSVRDSGSSMSATDDTPPNMPSMLKLSGAAYVGITDGALDGDDILVIADDILTTTDVQLALYAFSGTNYTKVSQGVLGNGCRWPTPIYDSSTGTVDLLMGGINSGGDLVWQRYDGSGSGLNIGSPSAANAGDIGSALFGGSQVLHVAPYHQQRRVSGALVVVEDPAPQHPLYTEFNHLCESLDAIESFASYYSNSGSPDPDLAEAFEGIGNVLHERLANERLYTADLAGEAAVYHQSRRRLLLNWDTFFSNAVISDTLDCNTPAYWRLMSSLVALGAQEYFGYADRKQAQKVALDFVNQVFADYALEEGNSWASQTLDGLNDPDVEFIVNGFHVSPYPWPCVGFPDLSEELVESFEEGFAAPSVSPVSYPGLSGIDKTAPGHSPNKYAALEASAEAAMAAYYGEAGDLTFEITDMYTATNGAKCIEVKFSYTRGGVTYTQAEPTVYRK